MKKCLRRGALAYRKKLADSEKTALEQGIYQSLLMLLQTFKPCTVALFYPIQGEPNLLHIIANPVLNGFVWSLPVCTAPPLEPLLQFANYAKNDSLEMGQYQIPVPAVKHWVQPDVLLIPCVAFHRSGTRLGYGAGWYDRTINRLSVKPTIVGIAYADTEIQANFAQPHDQPLDFVVTEKEVVVCHTQLHSANP